MVGESPFGAKGSRRRASSRFGDLYRSEASSIGHRLSTARQGVYAGQTAQYSAPRRLVGKVWAKSIGSGQAASAGLTAGWDDG